MSGRHGAIQSRVNRRVGGYAEDHGLGTVFGGGTVYTLFWQEPDRQLVPDLTFIRAERLPQDELPDEPLKIVPDLVVEIISPNDLLRADIRT